MIPDIAAKSGIFASDIPRLNGSKRANEHFSGTFWQRDTEAEIIVEVTHRSKRRLFGLTGLAPLRDEVAPPRRPEPGRGPGRPPAIREEEALPPPPLPDRPLTPIERKAIDYSELEHWMAHADQVIRDTRRALDALARGGGAPASPRSQAAPTLQSEHSSDDLPESWLGGNGMDDHE